MCDKNVPPKLTSKFYKGLLDQHVVWRGMLVGQELAYPKDESSGNANVEMDVRVLGEIGLGTKIYKIGSEWFPWWTI